MRALWPPREAAQRDYERLREEVLEGTEPGLDQLLRFERLGLAGLIMRPEGEPVWAAMVSGACRPPWSPHHDPREQVLAESFGWLLGEGPGIVTVISAGVSR
jgi:hypothetical protein